MNGILINLKPEPVWFSADDDLFDKTELAMAFSKQELASLKFLIKPVSRETVQKALEKHTSLKRSARFVEGRRETVDKETLDQAGFVDDMTDLVLSDWEGLLDEATAQPLPITRENKLALANAYPKLGAALLEASGWAAARFKRQEDDLEKN